MRPSSRLLIFFFFNDTATTEIYTLSLHDALPILAGYIKTSANNLAAFPCQTTDPSNQFLYVGSFLNSSTPGGERSEEHTSELQSHLNLVCRLLLEKKKYREIKHQLMITTTTRRRT